MVVKNNLSFLFSDRDHANGSKPDIFEKLVCRFYDMIIVLLEIEILFSIEVCVKGIEWKLFVDVVSSIVA